MTSSLYTYLALGDSYTIGEGVPIYDSFPYQAVQALRKAGLFFHAPEILARTGWTTDELQEGMARTVLEEKYDLVSLLIGVNDQYRGQRPEAYAGRFESLLKNALSLAGNQSSRVFVLSIPDWSVTPFAEGRDRARIAAEIDAFNEVNRSLSGRYALSYTDITAGTRETGQYPGLLAPDGLHPSGKEYRRWVEKLVETIIPRFS